MKILLVHNFYGSSAPSGENTAVSAELRLLRNHGNDVQEFTRHSDELLRRGMYGRVKGACTTAWNPASLKRMKSLLREFTPDIVHIHNTFPLLSPSVLYATRELSIPTVLTLHNYRIGCAAATALRNDVPCTLCLDRRSVLPALRYGCYRESRLATLPVSLMIALHNAMETWTKNVDAFITLTNFQKTNMAGFGLPEAALHVKPHFLENPPTQTEWRKREPKALFIGRLYSAKGIHILVESWKKWGINAAQLEIIGDGPMMQGLVKAVAGSDASGRISFVGNVSHEEAMRRLSTAKLLIVPSICFEGFPMVIQEAYAFGVPVAASRIGSLPELVDEGVTGAMFLPADPGDLFEKVRALFADDNALKELGTGAGNAFVSKYTSANNYAMLMDIYRSAAVHRSARVN